MKKDLLKYIKDGKLKIDDIGSIDKNNFENFFNVVYKGDKSYFNLCKGLSFDNIDKMAADSITNYAILEGDTPTLVSYKFYKTIKLWWFICLFNGIKNPFTEWTAGKVIRIPNESLKDIVLNIIAKV